MEAYAKKALNAEKFTAEDIRMIPDCLDYKKYGESLLARQGYYFHADSGGYIRRNDQEFHDMQSQPAGIHNGPEMKFT